MNATKRDVVLYCSVFYGQSYWNSFLAQCIPLIRLGLEKQLSPVELVIHFRRQRGSHIGLSFFMKEDITQNLLAIEIINSAVISFLEKQPSRTKKPVTLGIFKNFPNNSLHYQLHVFPFDSSNNLGTENLKTLSIIISNIILEELSQEKITQESLFTMCLYLHLLLFRSMYSTLSACRKYLSSTKITMSECIDTNGVFEAVLSENANIIQEIILNIFDDVYIAKQSWMKGWMIVCEQVIMNCKHMPVEKAVSQISNLTAKQLGMNSELVSTIYRLMNKQFALLKLDRNAP